MDFVDVVVESSSSFVHHLEVVVYDGTFEVVVVVVSVYDC